MTIPYKDMTDPEKIDLLKQMYEIDKISFADIATKLDTYPNKIRRDAKRLNINIRDKSQAQKNALDTGKHKHPTKGTQRDDETKNKIGMSVLKSWGELTEQELEDRRNKAKDNWESMSIDDRQNILAKANSAVRKASKEGSKLEKFLLERLIQDGHKTIFHQEQFLSNTKLQIDLFIPTMNIAIEVDGPSHFLPVWGDDALSRNKNYDSKKEGLIIGKGLLLIRIQQTKDFSKTRAELVYSRLLDVINGIANKTLTDKTFTIGDDN
jgi:very-short-patch-repair endonuclease